jgi:flagella basal body P-ring formation protein FlgA
MADYCYARLLKCIVLPVCALGLGAFSTVVCGAETGELLCSRDKVGTFWGPPGKVVYLTKTVKGGTKLTKECLVEGMVTKAAIPVGSIPNIKSAVGRIAAYQLDKGLLLNESDLLRK